MLDSYKPRSNEKERVTVLEENTSKFGRKWGYAQNIIDIEEWYKHGDITEIERRKLSHYNDIISFD